jgi:ABC-type multidrug transport system ATPase subunit
MAKPMLMSRTSEEIKRVEISWNDIYYTLKTKKGRVDILKGVSGRVLAGDFLTIMGSSGAGKTTLLNFLSDRVQKNKFVEFSGEVLANYKNINDIAYNNYVGYVTQEDILIDTMTVKECLMFSARLKLKGTDAYVEEKVEAIILELKLEGCKNTYIGSETMKGVSGGEKKRTSIGIELITEPSVLFLDEPTSGLDSFTAAVVVGLLVSQSKKGRTVITTLHQPSSDIFSMFDKLLLMSDGLIMYHGKASECAAYFEQLEFPCPPLSNPADYFIEVLYIKKAHNLDEEERRRVQLFGEAYRNSGLNERSSSYELEGLESGKSSRKSSFFLEFKMNFLRFWLRIVRNPLLSVVRIFVLTFVGLLIDIFYYDLGKNPNNEKETNDRNGVLFFISMNLVISNLQSSVLTFPVMRRLLIKEYNSNMYGVTAFFLSKNFIDIFFDFFFTLYFGSIVYWAVGLNDSSFDRLAYFFLIAFVTQMCGGSLGFLVGTIFKRKDVAVSFTAFAMLPSMYFSGFYRAKGMPDAFSWIENLSMLKYSFQAFAKNEYEDLYDDGGAASEYIVSDLLNISMSIDKSILYLTVLMVVLRVIAWGSLQYLVRSAK